jgi:hypothetical protein
MCKTVHSTLVLDIMHTILLPKRGEPQQAKAKHRAKESPRGHRGFATRSLEPQG